MKKIIFLLALTAISLLTIAQTVTGKITDLAGEPLIGASVMAVGTEVGTITDYEGNFTLAMPEGKVMVQVSYIGYKTKVINVKGKNELTISLDEDAQAMEEVVVVGYGVMKKSDVTGSLSQIKASDLMTGNTQNLAQGLQGKIAGVAVQQNDGAPGAGTSITIRGTNSFSTSTEPLYIIDGVPFNTEGLNAGNGIAENGASNTSNPLSQINPHKIEKIEVLKDASATAIYGSRGANGVVIITTKKGREGKVHVEVGANITVSQIARKVEMLNAPTYAAYQNECIINSNKYDGTSSQLPYRGEWEYPYIGGGFDYQHGKYNPSPEDFRNPGFRTDEYGNRDEVAVADWQNEIYRIGITQDYHASVSGASDKGWYNFSGGYTNQQGIIKSTGYERYNVSLGIGRKVCSWLELGLNSIVTNSTTNFQRTSAGDYGIIRSSLIFPPTYGPLMDQTLADDLNWLAANPVNYINGAKDQLKAISWWSSAWAEFKIRPYLTFRQNLGMGYNDSHRGCYYDRHTQEGKSPINGKGSKTTSIWRSFTSESILTYDQMIGIHHINVMGAFTIETGKGENTSMIANNFPSDATKDIDMSLALDRAQISSSESEQRLVSFLARVNYGILNRYLFTASARVDGSSKFITGNKWAPFFSGAFAWRMSEEDWLKNQHVISNWKWRVSYGQTGNQGIGSYRTLALLEAANYPYTGTLESGLSTIDWRGPANPDLKWETTSQWDAGVDIDLWQGRLNFTADYYHKVTRDLLQTISIPYSSGYGQMLVNRGNVTNQGAEFTLTGVPVDLHDWNWTLSANISFNRNKIGGLDGDQFATNYWSKIDQVYLQRNGCPIGTLYGYKEDGFTETGEIIYSDLDGDGSLTEKDRTIIGDVNPDFIGSLTSTLTWRDLSFSFMFQGSYGNDIFYANLMDIKMGDIGNITRSAYEGRWTPETAATATWPRATKSYTRLWLVSDRYVEDGSYLRLKHITLSYNWRNPCKGIEGIQFTACVGNVFTITKYSWFDPDVNAMGNDASRRGVDNYSYPSARTFSLGINFLF